MDMVAVVLDTDAARDDSDLFIDWARGFDDGREDRRVASMDATYCEGFESGVIAVAGHWVGGDGKRMSGLWCLGFAHGVMATTSDDYTRQRARADNADYQAGVDAGWAYHQDSKEAQR